MPNEPIGNDLERAIAAGLPLRQVVSTLRTYRNLGVSRHEVQLTLEALRDRADDEASEDRILEIMDVVSGFCSQDDTVWEDGSSSTTNPVG